MKREIKLLAIILAVLAAGAIGFVLLHGTPMSVYVPMPDKNLTADRAQITFTGDPVLETEMTETKGNLLRVRLNNNGNGAGSARVSVTFPEDHPNWSYDIDVNVSSGGTLTDKANGNFSGWQGLVVSQALFFLAAAVVFFTGYRKSLKTDFYSYTTVLKLSLHFLFVLIGLLNVAILVTYFLDPSVDGLREAVLLLLNSASYFVMSTAPLLYLLSLLLIVSNMMLIKREGFFKLHLLGFLCAFLIAAGVTIGFILPEKLETGRNAKLVICALNCYWGTYCFFECILLSVLIIFLRVCFGKEKYGKDYMIILGCQIRKDGTLYPLIRGRVDRALAFAKAQMNYTGRQVVFVPSGGQGKTEPISEGKAMSNYLTAMDIPSELILAETESENTLENFRFSMSLISEQNHQAKVGFCTTNYHVFRSGVLAAKNGWKMDGIGSRTKWYFWPNALVREFVALLAENKRGVLRFFVIVLAISILTAFFN